MELGDIPIVRIILEYRKLAKLLATYVESITNKVTDFGGVSIAYISMQMILGTVSSSLLDEINRCCNRKNTNN